MDGTVTFDPSKAQPLNGAPPPSASQAVTFDPSKAQPLTSAPPGGIGGLGGFLQAAQPAIAGVLSQYGGGAIADAGAGMLTGGVKRAGAQVGTVADLVSHTGLAKQHLQDAAKWLHEGAAPDGLWENVGATGTDMLELLGTDGLVSLAGEAAAGTEAGSAALAAVKNLKGAQQVGEFLTAHPKIAGLVGIGLRAAKDATTFGGQTYLTTEDLDQAKRAAEIGGVTGAVAPAILSQAGKMAKGVLSRFAPETVDIAEQTGIPVAKGQLSKEGEILPTGTENAPEIARAQQGRFDAHLQNTSRVAAANSIGGIVEAQGEPISFRVAGAMNPAEAVPTNLEPEYFKLGDGPQPAWVQRMARKEPGTAGETLEGKGAQTLDPHEAAQWQNNYEQFIGSPTFKDLPEAEQTRIMNDNIRLKHQLDMHYSPSGGRMPPVDMDNILSKIVSPGDAATQIKAVNGEGWAEINRVSDGEVERLAAQAKDAKRTIWNPNASAQEKEAARAARDKAQSSINDLLDKHAGDTAVTTSYYKAMKQGHADASFLSNLNDEIESMANGMTRENTAGGKLVRVVTGNTKGLEDFLANGQNRKNLVRLMGPEAEDNLKAFTELLSSPGITRKTGAVLANTVKQMAIAGTAGGGAVWPLAFLSHHGTTGVAIGSITGMATYGARQLLRVAASTPTAGRLIEYAVKNDVDPAIYAPLIARTIMGPFQAKQQQQEQKEQEQPQQ